MGPAGRRGEGGGGADYGESDGKRAELGHVLCVRWWSHGDMGAGTKVVGGRM